MKAQSPHGWHGDTTDKAEYFVCHPWYCDAIRGDHPQKKHPLTGKWASDGSSDRSIPICDTSAVLLTKVFAKTVE